MLGRANLGVANLGVAGGAAHPGGGWAAQRAGLPGRRGGGGEKRGRRAGSASRSSVKLCSGFSRFSEIHSVILNMILKAVLVYTTVR